MPIFIPVKNRTGIVYYESTQRRHKGQPDRCYYAVYRLGSKKIREKVGWQSEGVTVELAAQVRAERVRDVRLGALAPTKNVTVNEVWGKYLTWAKSSLSQTTSATSTYSLHIRSVIGAKNLKNVGVADLEQVRVNMVEAGLSKQYFIHAVAIIRALFNRATEWGMFNGANPTSGYKTGKANNRRERYLTEAEAGRLLSALQARSQTLHDMALLSLHTGMRYGEIAALRWDHVDFETGLIVVMESGNRLTTKGGKNRRLPMSPEVRAMLQSRATKFDRVFRNQQDKAPNRPDTTFKRVVDSLGLNEGIVDRRQRVVFHTLRHTFASWLAIRGVPLIAIRDLLGHSTIAMTERYAHLMPNQGRAAIDLLPRLAGQSSAPSVSPDTPSPTGADT